MTIATAASTDVALRVFTRLLDAHGLRYALYSILRLTDYRFITVFRFEDGMITSLAHVDREDLSKHETAASAESASYCRYVRSADGPFVVVDATVDPRVDGHAKQRDLRPIAASRSRPRTAGCSGRSATTTRSLATLRN